MKMDLFNHFSNNDLISNCASLFNANSNSNMQLHNPDYGHCSEFSNRSYQYGNPRSLSASDLFTPSVFVTIPLQNQSPTNVTNNLNHVTNTASDHSSAVETNLNTHYTNLNYNNNSNKSGNEIKSEPIKVEMAENNQNKDKSASGVSIISSTIITSNHTTNQGGVTKCNTNLLPLPSSNSLLVTARPKKSVICYKCDKCPFISISQNSLNQHYDQNHKQQEELIIRNTSKKLTCPGCENIFYIRKSLETHLLNDHQMNINEIETLLNSLLDCTSGNSSNEDCNEIDSSGNMIVPQKNRISIKNVKILQNPNLINSNELFNDTFCQTVNIGDSATNNNCSNQKIYLKNPIYLLNNNNTNKIYEQSILPSLHLSSTTSSSSSSFESIFNEQNFIEMAHNNSDVQIEDAMHDQNNYIIDLNGNSNSNNNNTNNSTNLISDDKHSLIGQQQQNNNGLHLRTVDELNLLDLTDVENNFLLNSSRETSSTENHNDKVVVLQQCNIINNANVLDAAANSDDFIFIEHDNEMDQNGYGNDDNDDNINFVCAEEIINENQFENDFSGGIGTENVYSTMDCDNFEVVKKNRGRPKGSKQTGITQLKKMYVNLTSKEIGYKCSIPLCAMRFHSKDILVYHEKCHSASNYDIVICPECSNDNRAWNWNTLHTHLWRYHNIDMELHSCKLCNFKTPILSRLNNTHIKIHSTERNFKCEQCDKAFKNTKQLKNHRRLHRINNQVINHEYKKCSKCSSIFKDVDLLKVHIEQMHSNLNSNAIHENNNNNNLNKTNKFKCPHCDKVTNSKSNLKLHILIHMENKKFKCDKENCCYGTNDHNAFRRHKMKHNQNKRYKCSFCNYTSIQSTTFKNHILKNHASKAPDLVFQCKACTFVTINKQKYSLHMKKHDSNSDGVNSIADKLIDDNTNFIDLEELDEDNTARNVLDLQSIATTTISSDSSPNNNNNNNDDNIILSSTTIDQPLIRPAVFANNFSNIENFRFTKILDLNDKFDTVNFSNIYDETLNYNHIHDDQTDNLDAVVRVHRILNDSFGDNNKDCFNIDLT